MKQLKTTRCIIMIIGLFTICTGLVLAAKGNPINEYIYSLFIGVTLTGSSMIGSDLNSESPETAE